MSLSYSVRVVIHVVVIVEKSEVLQMKPVEFQYFTHCEAWD